MVSMDNNKVEFASPTLSHRPGLPISLDSRFYNPSYMAKNQLLVSSDLFTFEASFDHSFLHDQLQRGEQIIANQVKHNVTNKNSEQTGKLILRPIIDEAPTAHRAIDTTNSPDAPHLGPNSNEMDLYPSIFGHPNSNLNPMATDETHQSNKHILFHLDNQPYTPGFKQRLDHFNGLHGRSSSYYHSNTTFIPPLRKIDDARRSSTSKSTQPNGRPRHESRDIIATGMAVSANAKRSTSRISTSSRLPNKGKSLNKSYGDMYPNAMEGGGANFQQRLSELASLQLETVRLERLKKVKRKS